MLDHSKPFEFYAVLQKYDTPNRNGRLYPERILKREADNYKKMIPKMGMKRDEHIGNLIIEFNVIFPEKLSDEQIEGLAKIL